jgi:hypothetical protein
MSIKLRKNRRSTITLPKGCTIVFVGSPQDGKPAVLVELPDGSTVSHETLTPPVKVS